MFFLLMYILCKWNNHYNKLQRAKTQPAYNQYDELDLGCSITDDDELELSRG
jgi:hypothetical protein